VNGPRFTEGLSWLHHLRGRNNEIRNNESGWLVRTTKGREGTRGVGEGGGRGSGPETREPGNEGSPDARAASTRRFPRRRAPESVRGRAHLRRQLLLLRPTNASAMAVQLPGPPCLSICSRSNASSCDGGWGR
jgi:hypothetical protein